MQEMFQDKGYDQECAALIFSFLHQYDVLLPVDKETALVPSMISPIPVVRWIDGRIISTDHTFLQWIDSWTVINMI